MSTKLPLIRRILTDSQYHWMLKHLPHKIMFVYTWIDNHHKMWLPRWGWSFIAIKEAEDRAKELSKKIKWE